MGKAKEIWQIITRKDFKDGEEVHAVKFNGGLMLSDKLYKSLKLEIEEMPDTKYMGELYGVKIPSTPYLPYIYRKVKRGSGVASPTLDIGPTTERTLIMTKELDEILAGVKKELDERGKDEFSLADKHWEFICAHITQAISDLLKEQKLQLLKEVEESVMGAIDGQYEMAITDLEREQYQTGVEIPVLSKTKLRTQIIKSIKELGEKK